ncbi:MAG: tRNA lysidine(34) synthetase TilS [Ruminococcus sp.]
MNIKNNFITRMERFIAEEQLLPEGGKVCCGLSGGADSVALLLGMLDVSGRFGIEVSAVHVNHCLRGDESDGDERFCRELCERLGVPLHVHRCDVKAYRESHGGSLETAARECRYAAFEKEEGLIATAHTASDNLETIIQRLARGTGLHGLCGIPVKRNRFIRPLLFAARQDVEEFLSEKGQDFVTDSSNNSDDYTRNRIRHNIVPLLQELNPSVERTVFSMCRSLRTDDDFFEEECTAAFREHFREPFCLKGVSDIPKAVRVRCESMLLEKCGISADSRKLHDIEKTLETGGRCHIAGDFDCLISKNELVLRKKSDKPHEPFSIPLKIGRQSVFPGISFNTQLLTKKNEINECIINENFTNRLLDYDKIKGCIILRSRKPGDRIKLAGRDFTVLIKKRIQEVVPLSERSVLHFLEDEEGTIFAEKIGIAERVKPAVNETERLLVVSIIRDDEVQPQT